MRADDDAKFGADKDNDGIPDEIEEIGDQLWDHQQMLYALALRQTLLSCAMNLVSHATQNRIAPHQRGSYALFTHYASLNSSLDCLTLNSWTELLRDAGLVNKQSRFCKQSNFDMAFMEADMMGKTLAKNTVSATPDVSVALKVWGR